jgi:hypothetical protein
MREKAASSYNRETKKPDRRDFYLGFLSSTCISMFVIMWKAGLIL